MAEVLNEGFIVSSIVRVNKSDYVPVVDGHWYLSVASRFFL